MCFDKLKTPNKYTKSLSRAKVFEEYKLVCLNYYAIKGQLPNSVVKRKILQRLCKQFNMNFNKVEKDLLNNKLTRFEEQAFTLKTFDLNTIDNPNV